MTTVVLTRIFRLGATDFPDPDPELVPEQVLAHFAGLYPQLRFGKITEGDVEGDAMVFTMTPNEFKPNG